MGLNHKHLTYNKANIDFCCQAIWILWIFSNNIDRGFTSVNSVASDPQNSILPSSQVHICIICSLYQDNMRKYAHCIKAIWEMCPQYQGIMRNIRLLCQGNMRNIMPNYQGNMRNMPTISRHYEKHIPAYQSNMRKIWLLYQGNMRNICPLYQSNIRNICTMYQGSMWNLLVMI